MNPVRSSPNLFKPRTMTQSKDLSHLVRAGFQLKFGCNMSVSGEKTLNFP
jgi:hypothetical protein